MILNTQEILEQISKRDSLQRLETFLEQDNLQQLWSRKMLIWCRTIYKDFPTSMALNNLHHHFSKTNLKISTVSKQTQFKEPLNTNNLAHFSREMHSTRINHSTAHLIQVWMSKKMFLKCLNQFKSFLRLCLRISQWRSSKQVLNLAIKHFWQLISNQLSKLNRKKWW